jgi:hypothetical protein
MDNYEEKNGFTPTKEVKTKFDYLKQRIKQIGITHKLFISFAEYYKRLQKNHIHKAIM